MRFVDTNVLVYAVSELPEDEDKRSRALELLSSEDLAVSVQVLQEFYVQATRPSRKGALTHSEAVNFVNSLQRFPVRAVTTELMREAFAIRERFGLSYWDASILAAARLSGCDTVYSEDMSADQDYDGLRVVNAFSAA